MFSDFQYLVSTTLFNLIQATNSAQVLAGISKSPSIFVGVASTVTTAVDWIKVYIAVLISSKLTYPLIV